MANSVQAVQPVNALSQTQPAAKSSKPPAQNTTNSPTPQDKVTVSPQARQALANNTKPSAGGHVGHDGDHH